MRTAIFSYVTEVSKFGLNKKICIIFVNVKKNCNDNESNNIERGVDESDGKMDEIETTIKEEAKWKVDDRTNMIIKEIE